MPVILGQMDVFPGAETDSIRRALEAAAPACASGISWTVSFYEGADLAGTRVTLDGPALSMIWTLWTQNRPGRYSTILMRDGSDWPQQLQECVGQMIRRSS
jgi:hypothetical protein